MTLNREDTYVVLANARRGDSGTVRVEAGDLVKVIRTIPDNDGDIEVRRISDDQTSFLLPRHLAPQVIPASNGLSVEDRVEVFHGPRGQYVDPETIGKTGVLKRFGPSGPRAYAFVDFGEGGFRDFSVYIDNLRSVGSTDPLASVPRASSDVDEYFEVGNIIRFTVKAQFDRGLVRVGCKEPKLADVTDSLVSMDKELGTATFEAEVTDDFGSPVIAKHGEYIAKIDAREWFTDVQIIKVAAPPRPNVSLTLTAEEADALLHLTGRMAANGPTVGVFRKLSDTSGRQDDQYELVSQQDGTRAPGIRLRKIT